MRYRTYTLRIEAREGLTLTTLGWEGLHSALSHAEDVVNDALPEGLYCKIDESGEGVDMAAVENLERFAAENEGDGREPDGQRWSGGHIVRTDR